MDTMYLRYFDNEEEIPLFIQFGNHNTDLIMHTHADFSELVIVLNGTAMHKVNTESYFIKKGDVFVISNNTAHGYINTHDFHICNIMYRPEKLQVSNSDIRKLAGFHALFVIEPYLTKEYTFVSRLQLHLTNFEYVSNILNCMLLEYEKKIDGWKTFLDAQFMSLIVYLSRLYSLPSSNSNSHVINIAKSVSYMESHFTELISIDELAAQSCFSTRHFTRVFRDTYQTTPGNYIILLRLQHACSLLKNTTLSITDIAIQSGFNSGNYFTRLFHNYFHVTPKEYRSQNK